ncbi:MAG: hypothetical protein LBM98_03895 [Oscillospiraceae bacterium]|nr:hypothetical protein [Oscillospiraceae bacterium]
MDEGYGDVTPRRAHPTSKPHPLCGGVRPQAGGGFPAPCAGQGLPLPVIASAAALAIRRTFRRAAIQCRERNIRMLPLRHWIASHL